VQDSPDAAELLEAIANTLEHQVLPQIGPLVQHQVRVAANLCRILQREAELGAESDRSTRARLASVLGHDGPSIELWQELGERIDTSRADDDDSDLHGVVLAIVRDKLAVAKPGYDRYDFARERS
jgi:hypothetical protein